MDCPRCGDALERYALEGREAVTCGACGYIGVPVEHRGEFRAVESWDEALSRLSDSDRSTAATVETGDPAPTPAAVEGSSPPEPAPIDEVRIVYDDTDDRPTCEVCGETFDSRRQLHGHSAVHAGGDT